MGDIIWYNDLVNTNQISDDQKRASFESSFCPINDSATVLFSCETFEVLELSSNGPGLIFGSYTGHSIEFLTNTRNPTDRMLLKCEGWCQLICKRVKDDQSIGQEIPFTLLSVLDDGNFCDVTLKSCDNVIVRWQKHILTICKSYTNIIYIFQYNVHSPILRLNGFDCSSVTAATAYQSLIGGGTTDRSHPPLMKVCSVPCAKSPKTSTQHISQRPSPTATSNFLLPPTFDVYNLSPKLANISNSFNCLTANDSIFLDVPKKHHVFSSDSNLNSDRNIFFFPAPSTLSAFHDPFQRTGKFKIPASPFRARSPSPFPCSLETPPSSPLTPLSVLNNIPSKMLSTILHWLYCESLPEDLDEETCTSLIAMCESTIPLSRMTAPCKNFLRNIQLKKCKVFHIMDHLNNVRLFNTFEMF